MPLTDPAVRQVKPSAKPVKLSDEKGLYLLIQPSGSKLWRWKYRYTGKEKVMPLGSYPEVSLASARKARDEARFMLKAGTDPMEQRKASKHALQAAADNAFETIARQWWEHWRSNKSPRHANYTITRLEADVFPALGSRAISAITAPPSSSPLPSASKLAEQ